MSKYFLFPRTESPLVFSLVTAIYTGIYAALAYYLVSHLVESDNITHPIDSKFKDFTPNIRAVVILFLKPLIDALFIAGMLETLRRSRLSPRLQLIAAVCLLMGCVSLISLLLGIILIPLFVVYVAAYDHWRQTSFETAFSVTFIIQMLHNVFPAARMIYAS